MFVVVVVMAQQQSSRLNRLLTLLDSIISFLLSVVVFFCDVVLICFCLALLDLVWFGISCKLVVSLTSTLFLLLSWFDASN